MKKFLAGILAALMCVSMVACSKKDEEKKVEDNTLVCGVTIFENMNEKDADGNEVRVLYVKDCSVQ